MTRPSLLLLATLIAVAPACAQRQHRHTTETTTSLVEEHDGERLELRISGQVDFNDEADWVVDVADGGSLRIEERAHGRDRRVEFTPGGSGGVRVRYWSDGDEQRLDGEARAWAQRAIIRAVREGGIGADRRVPRIRQRSGVAAVLEEIGHIRGESGRRLYYFALLQGEALSNSEFEMVMADVARRLGSDTETRLVLTLALDQAGGSAVRQAAALRVLSTVQSDTEKRLVLTRALELGTPRDAAGIQALFRAVGSMQSNTERRLVLTRLADNGIPTAMREPFFTAVEAIGSDVERRIVLSRVLSDQPREVMVVSALRAATSMRSDTEKRIVLSQVSAQHFSSDAVVSAYRQVLRTMTSDTERSIALRRLAAGS
jgi:hypothetical protein